MTRPVPERVWKSVVAHVPLVSVDLVVEHGGGVLLGKRANEPAKGEWFVPGGVVRKGESLETAVHRVATDELGCDVSIRSRLGAYEHQYDTSEFDGVDKHYVAIAYVVAPENSSIEPDDQHGELRVFEPPFAGHHEYVQAYLDDYQSTDG